MHILELVERHPDWYFFPLKPGTKLPATRTGHRAATNDPSVLQRWSKQADYGWGIWTGASNVVVLDLDPPLGISNWLALWEDDNEWEHSYIVLTPRNGLHVYFQQPPGIDIRPSTSQFLPDVDVRAAGSYVVATGTVLSDGTKYEDASPPGAQPIDMPTWMVLMLEHQEPTRSAGRMTSVDRDTLQRSIDAILGAQLGERNAVLNERAFIAYRYATEGIDSIEAQLFQAGIDAGLSESEVTRTLRSAQRAALRNR